MKKHIAVLLFFLLSRALFAESEKELVIAFSKGYPPMSILKNNKKINGMLVDIWNLWAERAGKKVRFAAMNWEETLQAIKDGKADIHSGLFKTPERLKWMAFSKPFYELESCVFYSKKLNNIKGLNDLKGKKIGIVKGSYQEAYLKKHCPEAVIVEFKESDAMITSAAYGWLQAFMDEVPTSLAMLTRIGRLDDFNRLETINFKKDLMAGVLKERAGLIDEINKGFEAISVDEIAEIEKRWTAELDQYVFENSYAGIDLTEAEKEWLKNHKTIRIGLGKGWPPFQYIGHNGDYHGIATDYVNILQEELGIDVEIARMVSWQDVLEKAKKREIDILACLGETEERRKFLDFSRPYLSFPIVIFVRKNVNNVKNILDLYGKKVAVLRGLVAHDDLERQHGDISIKTVDSVLEGLTQLSLGDVDAYVGNLATAGGLIQTYNINNIKVAGAFKNNDLGMAVRNDWPEFISIANKVLAAVPNSQKDHICRKWFTAQLKEHSAEDAGVSCEKVKYGLIIFAVFVALILIVLYKMITKAALFKAMVENEHQIVFLTDKYGIIKYASTTVKRYLDYSSYELIETPITEIFGEQAKSDWNRHSEDFFKERIHQDIIQLKMKDGSLQEFEITLFNKLETAPIKSIMIIAELKHDSVKSDNDE